MNQFCYFLISRYKEILLATLEHIEITFISIGISILIGVPLGIMFTRFKKIVSPVLGFASVVQTIPSLALLGLMIPIFSLLNLPAIGKLPAIVALFLYALLPIMRNTYTGIKGVNPSIIEAGIGMGMTDFQILYKVELPLSIPIIMAGIRTSTVINVGVATICALIGAGGLGTFIFRGIATVNSILILSGAIPAAILALGLDFSLGKMEKILSPRGIRITK